LVCVEAGVCKSSLLKELVGVKGGLRKRGFVKMGLSKSWWWGGDGLLGKVLGVKECLRKSWLV
jgi:hypothetical protein